MNNPTHHLQSSAPSGVDTWNPKRATRSGLTTVRAEKQPQYARSGQQGDSAP